MSFFGFDLNISEAWLMIVFAGGGALWSAFQLRKPATLGKIGFKGRDYHRADDPISFDLYRAFWVVLLFCSVGALLAWYFDLGMKP